MTLEDVLAKLSPKTQARVHQASEVIIEKQEVPSIGLNLALRGGLGYGRQTLVWGNKSAGKSSFCLQLIAKAQSEGKVCAIIDSEHSYDPSWAARLGVDNTQLIHSPIKTIADMTDVGVDLMKNGVDLIVVDSISSLLPSSYFSKDDELKGLDGTKQIGSAARDLANAVQMLNYSNTNTALVLISQVRNQISTYGAAMKPTGGHAVMFFSSTSIKLWSSPREDAQRMEKTAVGDKLFNTPVAREVTWTIDFNKIGPPSQVGSYMFYYDGDTVGIDKYSEILVLADRYGVINKAGSWYVIYDEKVQGDVKAAQYFRDNPDVYERVVKELDGKL